MRYEYFKHIQHACCQQCYTTGKRLAHHHHEHRQHTRNSILETRFEYCMCSIQQAGMDYDKGHITGDIS